MTQLTRTTLAAIVALAIPTASALAAKAAPDPCKFQKTMRQGGVEISIDIPEGEPCGLGTFFLTIVPKKGDPQTLKADRDGMLTEAMLVELSGAAPMEIVVVAKGVDSAAYGSIVLFETVDGRYVERRVPRLSGDLAAGYAGRDSFSVKNGAVEREFPLFAAPADGGEPQPTGETRKLAYDFAANAWVAR